MLTKASVSTDCPRGRNFGKSADLCRRPFCNMPDSWSFYCSLLPLDGLFCFKILKALSTWSSYRQSLTTFSLTVEKAVCRIETVFRGRRGFSASPGHFLS